MLSNNTFFENIIQRLFDGLILIEEGIGVYVQHMLKMSSTQVNRMSRSRRALAIGGKH